jgi:sulfopyruvate decarboxylase subunit alpha
MAWESAIVDGFDAAGIGVVPYLPDTAVAPVLRAVQSAGFRTVRVEREESAVAVAAGAWVGGERGAVVCQSSGMANALNAVGSLAVPADLPFLGVVSRRGDLGEFNIAQVPGGYALPDLLEDLGVRNRTVTDAANLEAVVRKAAETAFSTRTPYVVCLDSAVTGYKQEATR